MKVFADENIPLLVQSLTGCCDVVKFHGRTLNNHDLITGKCRTLIVRSTTKVNEALLEGTKVEFVGSATSGIDHIEQEYLQSRQIAFAYAPGSNANAVAEYVVYAILKWANVSGVSPKGKTVGIIGYGNIGRIVARYAEYMGLDVLLNDSPLVERNFNFPNSMRHIELDELIRKSDILTNHVPLTIYGSYPTIGLLNQQRIASLKRGSLFIHASRGGVANEFELLKRLKNNEIYAAIDVWEKEPLINTELAKNTIISTPHIAGYSRDGKLRGTLCMLRSFESFSGKLPDYSALFAELRQYKPLKNELFRDFELLASRLDVNRRFGEDHDKFINTLQLADDKRKLAFDSLRKNYPTRRESL